MPEPVDLPQPGRTIGRGMLLGSWLVGMALATMWFQDRPGVARHPADAVMQALRGRRAARRA